MDVTSQLDVFGHNGDSIGMDGTQIGVLEQTNQVSLAVLLKSLRLAARLTFGSDGSFKELQYQACNGEVSSGRHVPEVILRTAMVTNCLAFAILNNLPWESSEVSKKQLAR